jgi:hypothetical protein
LEIGVTLASFHALFRQGAILQRQVNQKAQRLSNLMGGFFQEFWWDAIGTGSFIGVKVEKST